MDSRAKKILAFIILFALITSLCSTIGTFFNEWLKSIPIHTSHKILLQLLYIAINIIILLVLVVFVFKDIEIDKLF
jgi:hypothetical protein